MSRPPQRLDHSCRELLDEVTRPRPGVLAALDANPEREAAGNADGDVARAVAPIVGQVVEDGRITIDLGRLEISGKCLLATPIRIGEAVLVAGQKAHPVGLAD